MATTTTNFSFHKIDHDPEGTDNTITTVYTNLNSDMDNIDNLFAVPRDFSSIIYISGSVITARSSTGSVISTGSAGYVVKKEDDSTTAWTGTPTVDGNGNVSGMDHD